MKSITALLIILLSSSLWGSVCHELALGESIRVAKNTLKSKTKVPQKYTLKRTTEMEHEVYLDLKFKKTDSPAFRSRVESCYEEFNFKLKDELGRSIKLRLWSKEDDVPRPPTMKITIRDDEYRSNIKNYSSDIPCETIIHESLHLTGLGDEYSEEWMGLNPNLLGRLFNRFIDTEDEKTAFDCRALGPMNSVMNNESFLRTHMQVLFSGHINAIIYPNCSSKNSDYFSCVKKAYRTSTSRGSVLGCGRIQEICKTSNWLLIPESPLRSELLDSSIASTDQLDKRANPEEVFRKGKGSSFQ